MMLLAGVEGLEALKWSYAMGIPAVLAAGLYGSLRAAGSFSLASVALGNAASLVAGLLSMEAMLKLVETLRYEFLAVLLGSLYLVLSIALV